MSTLSRNYTPFGADELAQIDRDFADIAKMYSSQEQDNLIQIWTGTEYTAAEIQEAIQRISGQTQAGDAEMLGTDKGYTVLHLGFYKSTQENATYQGRSPAAQGIGMGPIQCEDCFGVNSTFTLWDQPTAGWTAIPAALFEVQGWCERFNPDVSAFPAAVTEIATIDANDDSWALLIFGVMELTASVDVYAFHWQSNRTPRPPYILENQIRVGDIQYARFGPIYVDKKVPFAFGLEFRGDVGDIPIVAPKLWGLCFYTQHRALLFPRTRCRLA